MKPEARIILKLSFDDLTIWKHILTLVDPEAASVPTHEIPVIITKWLESEISSMLQNLALEANDKGIDLMKRSLIVNILSDTYVRRDIVPNDSNPNQKG